MVEFFLYGNNIFSRYNSALLLPFIAFAGVFTGMGNEHIPPVLIAFSIVAILFSILKHKHLPLTILVYFFAICIGYALLYFAPANTERYVELGKENHAFKINEYFRQSKGLLVFYRYYLPEILSATIFTTVFITFFHKKINIPREKLIKIYLFFMMGFAALPIVAYAPLSGLRLLFFTNTLWVLGICDVIFSWIKNNRSLKIENIFYSVSSFCLVLFFLSGVFICYTAHENSVSTFKEIAIKSKTSNKVIVDKGFNYFSDDFNLFSINRRFFLESGRSYLDTDLTKDTNQEKILKKQFNLKELSLKNEN